jgi:hypothetical protein
MVHLGLSRKVFSKHVLGLPSASLSFFLPRYLEQIARTGRLHTETLLLHHTVFPFAAAFMAPDIMQDTLGRLLVPVVSTHGTAALVQSLSLNARRFVFCLACVEEDTALYGETYWHRAHFLPGIVRCPVHGGELFALPPGKHAGLPIRAGPILAERHQAAKVRRIGPSREFEQELARRCLAPLLPDWTHQGDWASVYRQMALEKGYVMKDGTIAGSQIAMDMMKAIGPATLRTLGCQYSQKITASWPATLVRASTTGQQFHSPLRHLLLATFLATCSEHTGAFDYIPVGPKTPNYRELDKQLARHARQLWEQARRGAERVSARGLVASTPMSSIFVHHREQFPLTCSVLEEFKRSDQAERQIGLRPYWRKRLGRFKESE